MEGGGADADDLNLSVNSEEQQHQTRVVVVQCGLWCMVELDWIGRQWMWNGFGKQYK